MYHLLPLFVNFRKPTMQHYDTAKIVFLLFFGEIIRNPFKFFAFQKRLEFAFLQGVRLYIFVFCTETGSDGGRSRGFCAALLGSRYSTLP